MSKREKNCQIPTPIQYVKLMLDNVGYKHNLQGRKVLENSCGEGNILVEIVKRYIADAKENQHTPEQIAIGLQRDVVAYEVDQGKIDVCLARLDEVLSIENIPEVRWNIKHQDFLKSKEQNIDFIVGNPPFITYHDLTQEEREFLQRNFLVCQKGRFDYCYAFIEASVKALSDRGKMVFLIPISVFRYQFAACVRGFLWDHITKIIDCSNVKIFQGIICSTSLILCENGNVPNQVEYEDDATKNKFFVMRSALNEDKWIFHRTVSGNRRFGDYFSVHNSVATLCNKAFLFSAEEETEKYYIINGLPVEKELTLPAVSTKSNRASKNGKRLARIIFPYRMINGEVEHYTEEEFKNQYICAWNYLYQFYDDLRERKSDKTAQWFEYGRSQALKEVFGRKLVVPMVITDSTKTYVAQADVIPYAGYFIKIKKGSNMTLQDAKNVLESAEFYQYVREIGTPTTPSSYRVSVYDISEFLF